MICLRISRAKGFRVRSGEAVGKPVGTPDGVQWMRVPEWSVDPQSAIALAQVEFKGIEAFSCYLASHLSSHSPYLSASHYPTPTLGTPSIHLPPNLWCDSKLSTAPHPIYLAGEMSSKLG